MPDARRTEPPARAGGIPDGVLVGLLAFLLGLAVLVWSATGLAALFSKGAWPGTVTFTRTPGAVRALIAQPHDIAAAWPDTDPAALSGWGLFWGLFISQLLVMLVLTIFTLGVVARTKARRTKPYAAQPPAPATATPPQTDFQTAPPATAAAPGTGMATAPAPGTAPTLAPGTGMAPSLATAPGTAPIPPQEPAPTPVPTLAPEAAAPPVPPRPAPVDEAYRYGFGYAPRPPAQTPADHLTTPTAPATPATQTAPARLTYATPTERHHLAARAIASAEGAVLVVTSSPALWSDTKDARAKLGPVLLYDPSHLCDTPARMHWNPAEGCADRDTAAARAIALLAPVRPQARLDAAVADTAETLLRSWLQAAALDERPFKQLHRWAQGNSAQDPVRILRTHLQAAPGAAGELESALTGHPERREQAQYLTARALSCLTSIHIREACTPNRTDALTLASFVAEGAACTWWANPSKTPGPARVRCRC